MERDRLVAATAANIAAWHDANLRALGYATAWRDGWWLTPDDVPVIYFRAIAVRPGADPSVPTAVCHRAPNLAVCDPWSSLALERHGMAREADRPWMTRAPGPVAITEPPAGISITRVADVRQLALYERTAAIGFGSATPPAGAWHGSAILGDRRFDHWLARGEEDDTAVGTGSGLREAGVLGIYSISTVPEARRRGIASAVTAHSVGDAPDLPAVLQPSEMAESIYRRLGFERFTTFRTWTQARR